MMRHFVRKPNGKRKSFSLIKQTTLPTGKVKTETLENADIENINAGLADGTLIMKEALVLSEGIRKRLNGEDNADVVQISSSNQKVLHAYWEAEYADRYLQDEDAAKSKLRRAIQAIEPESIRIATKAELAAKIKKASDDVNVTRQLTSSLNQLLRFCKRDFKLRLPKKPGRRTPRHLTRAEFERVMEKLTSEQQVPCWIAFLTGMRIGEVWATGLKHMRTHHVEVEEQETRTGDRKDPKWDSRRKAYALAGLKPWMQAWEKMDRQALSQSSVSVALRRACMQLWPGNPTKHCSFHDLRHSYAILLLPVVGMDNVALSLGNSVRVCQEYYAGFSHQDEGIEHMHRLVQKHM